MIKLMSLAKKYWPVGLLIIGILFFVGVWFFVIRDRGGRLEFEEEETVAEIPLEKRPVVSLTPTEDGHYLKLLIKKIEIEAATLDFEILYQTATGITQGVPGTVNLDGDEIDRDILLGSESSGKFRYDEGVETGTLSLKFRNDKGKLVGKLMGDWHLQTGVNELSSVDGKFKFMLSRASSDYFVVMDVFGLPGELTGSLVAGPYGVFGSSEVRGTPDGDWSEIGKGIFVSYQE